MKLEAKDLRIGNFIEGYLEPQIYEWLEMKVSVDLLSSIESKPNNHRFRPIKITEKWLLKFGFESDNYPHQETYSVDISTNERFDYRTIIKIYMIGSVAYVSIEDKEDNIIAEINDIFIRKIKHVHQLQNLYHALTGEELTIKNQ